jgi:hypothetical protein
LFVAGDFFPLLLCPPSFLPRCSRGELVFLPKAEFNSKSMNTYLIEKNFGNPFFLHEIRAVVLLDRDFCSLSLSLSLYTQKKKIPETSSTRNTLRNFTKGIFFFLVSSQKK